MSGLKQALSLWQATMFGIGLILGAGIYAVIGRTTEFAGPMIWVSVLLAGLIALLTGLSYAELSGMYPRASSSYFYVKQAFPGKEGLAFLVGWMIFFEAASGAATASIAFAEYLSALLNLGSWLLVPISLVSIILFSVINWLGIEESSKVNVLFTIIEASGLLMVIVLGLILGPVSPNYFTSPPKGWLGILQGAALIFFAYVGFELMATTSEETIDASHTVPKAILSALTLCSVLYALVAIAVVRLLPWEVLATVEAPLAVAAQKVLGASGWLILAFIALFSTSNTILGFLVSSSRIAYGMAYDGMLHKSLAFTDSNRGTPRNTVILAGVIASFEVLVTGIAGGKIIDAVAKASNLGALIAFIFVNIATIVLRRRENMDRPFKIRGEIKGVLIPPLIGTVLCILIIILAFHEPLVWCMTTAVVIIGLFVRKSLSKQGVRGQN